MNVGEKIRKYRTEQGLLQKDLAKKCRMSESAIRNYELGNRTPKPHHLEVIADALDISPYALLDPDLDSEISLMHAFFYLEESYGLQVVKEDGIAYMNFDIYKKSGKGMQDRLIDWADARKTLSNEEYEKWKDSYPKQNTVNKK